MFIMVLQTVNPFTEHLICPRHQMRLFFPSHTLILYSHLVITLTGVE